MSGLNLEYRQGDPLSDFRNFLYVVWEHLALPNPTPVQYAIAHYLQHGHPDQADQATDRIIIEAFRGVGKSWITSAFVCWLLYMNPQLKILVVSASKSRADDFTTFTMRLIMEMEILAHLRPGTEQRNSKIAFDVRPAAASHAPSVKSVGITGQLAGNRADVIVADDIEIPNNSQTQMQRDKLAESVKEFDAVLKPGGNIIYLGTPQTEMSLYNTLPNRGYKVRIWPARYPDEARIKNYGDALAPSVLHELENDPELVGHSTDPVRFSDFDLMERELSYGRSGFALQFMLDTRLSDAELYPLKVQDLIVTQMNHEDAPEKLVWAAGQDTVIDTLPNVAFNGDGYYRPMQAMGDWVPFTGSVMAIDPSGRGADELGYAVVKMLNGFLYVTRCGGMQGGYSLETLQALALIAKQQKVNTIIVESNFGDGMFNELFKPVLYKIHKCSMEEVRHSTQKEKRIIDTLEPVMNQHRLVIDQKVIQDDYETAQQYPVENQLKYQLIYQMTRITKERGALSHDDRLEALAIAVNYWVEMMGRDADKAMEDRKDDMIQQEIERLLVSAQRGNTVFAGVCPDAALDGYNMLD